MGKSKELAELGDFGGVVHSVDADGNVVLRYDNTSHNSRLSVQQADQRLDLGSYWEAGIAQHSYINTTNAAGTNAQSLQLRTGGTVRMTIDASGRVTMPYQPAFRAHYGGGTIANGTVIAWNSTSINAGGHYSTSTGRFTAPIAGKYAFFVQVHHSLGSGYTAGHQYFDLRKNGAQYQRFIGRWTVDDWYELTTQAVIELNASDYVDVLVFSANNQWMGSNRADHNHFTGYLIG